MGYKLALMMFIVASMGVGLWIIAGNQESDPSEFDSRNAPTTMDDGSGYLKYSTIGTAFIILWYCIISIRLKLADERRISPDSSFFEEEEEEQSTGRIETVESECVEVMDTKAEEDSEDQSKNETLETNHFEMVVFTKDNDGEQKEYSGDQLETAHIII
ncbi:hypothetical protein L5515_016649 [Caenorhabditis briggsae]|nr:hypothetical protein L3Y34_010762 [Caenorhabditis briggsae]ULT80414.1 hypothetical protein L3Y34_010765 [Caenorhabditis briggsae]UMM39720.1 hypothetical protein L5515_016649 [Caenorhabditis briggsae]